MRIRTLSLTAAVGLALGITSAMAQTNPPAPANALPPDTPPISPAATAGIAPPMPAVQSNPIPSQSTDIGGQQGFFAPSTTDTVVVPAFTPTTPGVTPVDTPTNATVGSSPSDRSLRDSVASAIAGDASLAGARINVTVSNGVVNLTGAARDQNQADRARAVAEGVAGASRVHASVSTGG